jgi:microcystin-dependent protein
LATTGFVQNSLGALYPVGSIYINAAVSTNPATLLGFGTWSAFGAGRVMVGLDAGNAAFDTAQETGGSADAIVVSHSHTATSSVSDPGHNHTVGIQTKSLDQNAGSSSLAGAGTTTTSTASTGISVSTSISTTGSSATNANLQPYIVVYMWRRTA